MKKYKTLKEFYPYYLTEHSDKTTKLFHFIGTALSIFFIVRLVITLQPINFVFALLSGYGFAWVSHFFVEKNNKEFKYFVVGKVSRSDPVNNINIFDDLEVIKGGKTRSESVKNALNKSKFKSKTIKIYC